MMYAKDSKSAARWSALLVLAMAGALVAGINFVLTPNPYAALHSGGVAYDALVRSESFAIQSNLVTMFALAVAYLYTCKSNAFIPLAPLLFVVVIVVSGLASGVIVTRPVTYVYDAISFVLVAALARHDVRGTVSGERLKVLFRLSVVTVLVAVTLALQRPNIWGFMPFDFSRESRGEATLAAMTGALLLIPPLALSLRSISPSERAAAYIFTVVVVASTATRSLTIMALLPLIFFMAFRRKGMARLFLTFFTIAVVAVAAWMAKDILILSSRNQTVVEATLTGRLDLWAYYWNAFWDAPILGNGSFLLERTWDYYGTAKSEIGLLKTAAEQGGIAAGLQLTAVLVACRSALLAIRNRSSSGVDVFTGLLVLSMTPNFVLQDHARVLNFVDAFFWYSVFFQMFRSVRRTRLAISFRVGKPLIARVNDPGLRPL